MGRAQVRSWIWVYLLALAVLNLIIWLAVSNIFFIIWTLVFFALALVVLGAGFLNRGS
jgi:hypothetical protein